MLNTATLLLSGLLILVICVSFCSHQCVAAEHISQAASSCPGNPPCYNRGTCKQNVSTLVYYCECDSTRHFGDSCQYTNPEPGVLPHVQRIRALNDETPVTGILTGMKMDLYTISIPFNAILMRVTIQTKSATTIVYLRHEALASSNAYDLKCTSTNGECLFLYPRWGTWFISVQLATDALSVVRFSSYSLLVNLLTCTSGYGPTISGKCEAPVFPLLLNSTVHSGKLTNTDATQGSNWLCIDVPNERISGLELQLQITPLEPVEMDQSVVVSFRSDSFSSLYAIEGWGIEQRSRDQRYTTQYSIDGSLPTTSLLFIANPASGRNCFSLQLDTTQASDTQKSTVSYSASLTANNCPIDSFGNSYLVDDSSGKVSIERLCAFDVMKVGLGESHAVTVDTTTGDFVYLGPVELPFGAFFLRIEIERIQSNNNNNDTIEVYLRAETPPYLHDSQYAMKHSFSAQYSARTIIEYPIPSHIDPYYIGVRAVPQVEHSAVQLNITLNWGGALFTACALSNCSGHGECDNTIGECVCHDSEDGTGQYYGAACESKQPSYPSRESQTAEEVYQLLRTIFNETELLSATRCVQYTNCSNCTENLGCGWIDSGLITIINGTYHTLTTLSTSQICWQGNLYTYYGISNEIRRRDLGAIESYGNILVQASTSDYYWAQCDLESVRFIVITHVSVIAGLILLYVIIRVAGYCYVKCPTWFSKNEIVLPISDSDKQDQDDIERAFIAQVALEKASYNK